MTTQKKVKLSQKSICLPTTILREYNLSSFFETYQMRPYPFKEELPDEESARTDSWFGHKSLSLPYSPVQRRDLLQLAYNGLDDKEIYTQATDTSYLKKNNIGGLSCLTLEQ